MKKIWVGLFLFSVTAGLVAKLTSSQRKTEKRREGSGFDGHIHYPVSGDLPWEPEAYQGGIVAV